MSKAKCFGSPETVFEKIETSKMIIFSEMWSKNKKSICLQWCENWNLLFNEYWWIIDADDGIQFRIQHGDNNVIEEKCNKIFN